MTNIAIPFSSPHSPKIMLTKRFVQCALRAASARRALATSTELPADWAKIAKKEIGGDPASLVWKTAEGIDVKPIYTAADTQNTKIDQIAGAFPYTRGPHATMYTQKPWTIRQYAGFSTAEKSNQFYKKNLKVRLFICRL